MYRYNNKIENKIYEKKRHANTGQYCHPVAFPPNYMWKYQKESGIDVMSSDLELVVETRLFLSSH